MSFAAGFADGFAPHMEQLSKTIVDRNKARMEQASQRAAVSRGVAGLTRAFNLPQGASAGLMEAYESGIYGEGPDAIVNMRKALEGGDLYAEDVDPRSQTEVPSIAVTTPQTASAANPAPTLGADDTEAAFGMPSSSGTPQPSGTTAATTTPGNPSLPAPGSPPPATVPSNPATPAPQTSDPGFGGLRFRVKRDVPWYEDYAKIGNREQAMAAAVAATRAGNTHAAEQLLEMYPAIGEDLLDELQTRLAQSPNGSLPPEEMRTLNTLQRMYGDDEKSRGVHRIVTPDGEISRVVPYERPDGTSGYRSVDNQQVTYGVNEVVIFTPEMSKAVLDWQGRQTQNYEDLTAERYRVAQGFVHLAKIEEILTSSPDANTAAARGAGMLTNLGNELGAMSRVFSDVVGENGRVTISQAEDILKGAVANGSLQSLSADRLELVTRLNLLTFAMLGAEGQQGASVSVAEFNRVYSLVAGSGNPDSLMSNLASQLQDKALLTEQKMQDILGTQSPSALAAAGPIGFNPGYHIPSWEEYIETSARPELRELAGRGFRIAMTYERGDINRLSGEGVPTREGTTDPGEVTPPPPVVDEMVEGEAVLEHPDFPERLHSRVRPGDIWKFNGTSWSVTRAQ